ncbi:MAG: hypothetical protein PHP82_02875 [Candidatus ainarchaeum sp.]|nr:hypothetical protein [Candidatus ainarchaeum sp.]
MGFFKKIFSKKNEIEEINTTLDLLPIIIQKNFESEIKNLELEVAKQISELKYLHEKGKSLLIDIQKKEIEEENTRFNKAALTSKKQIENQLIKTLEKINPENSGKEINEIRAYSNESYALFINEINSFRKNITYTSVYLKDEMKMLGGTLQEIINKLAKLNQLFFEKKEIFEFEKIKKRIKNIEEQNKEIKKSDELILNKQKDLEEKEKEIKLEEEKIIELKQSDELKEIKNIEEEKSKILEEKQQLKTEISSMLSTIDKPLQRFNALVKSGRWKIQKEKAELLENFITNPLFALKKDVNGKQFKEILIEIKKAINDEKIELKEKEKEKRIDALQELIAFDFFEKVFWKLNEIQKRQNEIENLIKKNNGLKKINFVENKKNEINKELNNIIEAKKLEELKQQKLTDFIKEEKEKIQKYAEKITGKNIKLE